MKNNIGFIGGGQMGEALIKGIIQSKSYLPENIHVADPSATRREFLSTTYNIKTYDSSINVIQNCATFLLAVKPQMMNMVLAQCKEAITCDHLIITIATGIPIATYVNTIGIEDLKVIRVMPNTPALIGESASALAASSSVTATEMSTTEALFNKIGCTVVIDESQLDAVTGLSGSGPAYVFSFVEALIDAGVAQGLSRPISEKLALQTVAGSVKLLQQNGEHPAVERAKVTSPGGTTITALQVLEKEGFQGIIMDAIAAATKKSKELGEA